MANSRQYTDEELIQRVWDVEEIKKLIHKRVIYIANEMRKEELNDLWVQNPEHKKTASFGRNTGYYTGMDAIHDYYVVHHQKEREKQLKKLKNSDLKILLRRFQSVRIKIQIKKTLQLRQRKTC